MFLTESIWVTATNISRHVS